MRTLTLALVTVFTLLSASMVHAAPTCRDQNAATIRCGTPGAMPVGWTPPPQMVLNQEANGYIAPGRLFGMVCLIGGFLGLIALMPDFEGWEQDDDEERG